VTWTPEQRRDLLARYQQLVHDTSDTIKRTDPPPGTGTTPARRP
jgi:hypothetical protein